MTPEQARDLLRRYRLGECSAEEERMLMQWADQQEKTKEPGWSSKEQELFMQLQADAIYQHIGINVSKKDHAPVRKLRGSVWWSAAAVILIVLVSGVYFFFNNQPAGMLAKTYPETPFSEVITSGTNKATLRLADGSTIELDNEGAGTLAEMGGVKVIKLDSGLLSYVNNKATGSGEIKYNILTTPRGGQYQILLPDGSHVWLNSASTLRFPTGFYGNTREVELTGEGYFEIKENKDQPFIVKAGEVSVNVLGTGFNVMAYDDEETVATTLIHGSVKVSAAQTSTTISPGEQASLDIAKNTLRTTKPNLNKVLAWKDGNFSFDNEKITSIMRQIARWYDVEVIYQGKIPVTEFSGSMSRKDYPSLILEAFELTNDIHFSIQEKTITVIGGPKP